MATIFLGKFCHWALLAVATVALWYCGSSRLHVISFNTFMIAMLIGTIAVLFTIIKLHRHEEQVTREKLEIQPFDPDADNRIDGD